MERMLTLLNIFTNRKYTIPKTELLAELECDEATFFRLRRTFEAYFGGTVLFEKKYGGYAWKQDESGETFPGVYFSAEEIKALICMDHLVEGLGAGFLKEQLGPLRTRLDRILHTQRIKVEEFRRKFRLVPLANRTVNETIFLTIVKGLLRSQQVSIVHRSLGSDRPTQRIVSPQTILHYRDNWYLDAWCHLRDQLRTFAVDRIEWAILTRNKACIIPAEETIPHFTSAYGIFSGKVQDIAVIRFTGVAAREVAYEQWHPNQTVLSEDDGAIVLKIPYSDSRELIMDILRWADFAEVLEPYSLLQEIGVVTKKMAEKYAGT